MRYNHRYHQALKHAKHPRRPHIASFVYLAVAILILLLVFKTPLDGGLFVRGFSLSLYRVSVAYIVCLVLAIILGLLATWNSISEAVILPIMDVAQSFPTFALIPIALHNFGKSSLSVIIILIIAMVWPIAFQVVSGVQDQRQDELEAAEIFGAVGWKFLAHYRLPSLRTHILSGSIVSWGQAWDTIVGAEIIAGVFGAGHYLGILGQGPSVPLLMTGIAVYLLLIFSLNQLLWLPLLHRYAKFQVE